MKIFFCKFNSGGLAFGQEYTGTRAADNNTIILQWYVANVPSNVAEYTFQSLLLMVDNSIHKYYEKLSRQKHDQYRIIKHVQNVSHFRAEF